MANEQGTTTVIEKRGGGMATMIGVVLVALVALVAVFLMVQSQRNDPSAKIADAATSIAGSASRAADSAGAAADNVKPAQ